MLPSSERVPGDYSTEILTSSTRESLRHPPYYVSPTPTSMAGPSGLYQYPLPHTWHYPDTTNPFNSQSFYSQSPHSLTYPLPQPQTTYFNYQSPHSMHYNMGYHNPYLYGAPITHTGLPSMPFHSPHNPYLPPYNGQYHHSFPHSNVAINGPPYHSGAPMYPHCACPACQQLPQTNLAEYGHIADLARSKSPRQYKRNTPPLPPVSQVLSQEVLQKEHSEGHDGKDIPQEQNCRSHLSDNENISVCGSPSKKDTEVLNNTGTHVIGSITDELCDDAGDALEDCSETKGILSSQLVPPLTFLDEIVRHSPGEVYGEQISPAAVFRETSLEHLDMEVSMANNGDGGETCCPEKDGDGVENSEVEFRSIFTYLSGGGYPPGLTKNQKSNFRKKCKRFSVNDGELYHKTRAGKKEKPRKQFPEFVLVVKTRGMQMKLVKMVHEGSDSSIQATSLSGHRGVNTSVDILSRRYWWPNFTADVKHFCLSCERCQKVNTATLKAKDPLQSVPPPRKNLQQIGIDLIQLPEVDGFKYVAVAIDYFSKYSFARPLRDKTAQSVARFIYEWICLFSCPKVVINDQGREFCNAVSEELFHLTGTEQRVTRAYHPQSNGQVERQNRSIKNGLLKVLDEHVKNWPDALDGVMFGHRVQKQKSTGYSPYFLLFNQEPVLPVDMLTSEEPEIETNDDTDDPDPLLNDTYDDESYDTGTLSTFVRAHMETKGEVMSLARENILNSQEKSKKYYDAKHSGCQEFKVGDQVWKFNLRREERKGDWHQDPYSGPYEIVHIQRNGECKLKNVKTGHVLARAHKQKHLKPRRERHKEWAASNESLNTKPKSKIENDPVEEKRADEDGKKTQKVQGGPDTGQKRKREDEEDICERMVKAPRHESIPLPVLLNGNNYSLPSVMIGDTSVSLSNTCSFDSIVQVLSAACVDSEHYFTFVSSQRDRWPCGNIIHSLSIGKPLQSIYYERAKILTAGLSTSLGSAKMKVIACESNARRMADMLLKQVGERHSDVPSLIVSTVCQSPDCPVKVRKTEEAVICLGLPKQGVSGIEERLVREAGRKYESVCHASMPKNSTSQYQIFDPEELSSTDFCCTGIRTGETRMSCSHLLLEIVRPNDDKVAECSVRLTDIPKELKLEGKVFHLRGAVEFIGSKRLRRGDIGHYVAHCLRINGSWERYDDISGKTSRSNTESVMNCHLIIYTV